jgi:hypothetical protein
MSYTDLLQSYQDRLSSIVQNEESVGDYLLNKGQEKINAYLEQSGIPAEIGGAIEQFGLITRSDAVQTVLQKSGLKGVFDEQLESLSRNVQGLKDSVKSIGQKAASAIDEQVSSAQRTVAPVLERTQQGINVARETETQAREGVEAVRQLPGQAQAAVEQGVTQLQGAAEQGVTRLQGAAEGAVENLTRGTQQAVEGAMSGVAQRASPEYLQSLTDEELMSAGRQNAARRAGLLEQFTASELPDREAVFKNLASQIKTEKASLVNEAQRRGLINEQGVVEEANLRPSQVNPQAPEFQAPTQQLPQIPQAEPRPQPPSEIEPAVGAEPRPSGYVEPTEQLAQEGEQAAATVSKTEQAISTTAKVGTTLEETTAELPEIGEVGEVLGALLQIGSMIASAFKPHEDVQTITTPVSGFGFGSLNQFGVGGSSIV